MGGNTSPADAASDTVSTESRRFIGSVGTAFYKSSPAQGHPPDGELSPGTVVELLESGGSYSLIQWNSERAWVATDAIREIEPKPREIHKIPMH